MNTLSTFMLFFLEQTNVPTPSQNEIIYVCYVVFFFWRGDGGGRVCVVLLTVVDNC